MCGSREKDDEVMPSQSGRGRRKYVFNFNVEMQFSGLLCTNFPLNVLKLPPPPPRFLTIMHYGP